MMRLRRWAARLLGLAAIALLDSSLSLYAGMSKETRLYLSSLSHIPIQLTAVETQQMGIFLQHLLLLRSAQSHSVLVSSGIHVNRGTLKSRKEH
jgi:hypothetical protein